MQLNESVPFSMNLMCIATGLRQLMKPTSLKRSLK